MNRKSLFIILSIILIVAVIVVGFIFKDSLFPTAKQELTPTVQLLSKDELSDMVVNRVYTSLKIALENPDDVVALQLYDQSLTEIPGEIFKFRNLQYLNLGKNLIRVLPKDIYKLSLLQEILLFNNQLTSLPAEMGRLKYLRRLSLSSNQLTALPDEFQGLGNLRYLELAANRLTHFPLVIGKLGRLEELDLSSNQLTDLPVEIKNLKSLTGLNISNNDLTMFPMEIFQLKHLSRLEMDEGQREVFRGMMAQDPGKAHPVIDGFFMALGGTMDGFWVQPSLINDCLFAGQKYRLYSFDQFLGEFENEENSSFGDSIAESDEIGRVKFNIEDYEILENVAFGVAGDWDVFPRKPILKAENKNGDAFLEDLLNSKGIINPVVVIQKEIVVDLDGDGVDEALLVASNITPEDIDAFCDGKEEVRKGKYSLVLLRRMVGGREENIIVAGDFNQLMEYDVSFVADVDNDQEMEFLVKNISIEAVPAEGFSVTTQELYKLNDKNKPEMIGDIFMMPR